MDVHSWCSMLGRGATNQFNYFVWSIYTVLKSDRFSANTAYNFWRIYTWSLYWLDRGLWPDRDWLGNLYTTGIDFARRLTPLAGVVTDYYFGVLWGIKNDLEYSWKELKLPNCNSNDCCCFCPANTTTHPMHDYSSGAAWLSSIYSKLQWENSVWNRHPLFRLPGVSIYIVLCDLMHVNHLGVDVYFLGSVLSLLCYRMLPDSPARNLAVVWGSISDYYKSNPTSCQLSDLTLSMFCNCKAPDEDTAKYPLLKTKANESRHFNKTMLHVWRLYMDAGDLQHKQIELGLQASSTMEDILDDNSESFALGAEAGGAFLKQTFTYLRLFNALAQHYKGTLMLFDVTAKAHYMAHAALTARYINPRLGWCYAGEDFMSCCKILHQMCSFGKAIWKTELSFVDRYVIAQHLELSRTF